MLIICRKMTTFIQKPATMLKKLPKEPQLEMFKTVLTSFIHPQHELCLLARKINWKSLEDDFAPLYGTVGRPSIPIRTIVGLLLLKQMYNLGDETVVQRWLENPYWSRVLGTAKIIFNTLYRVLTQERSDKNKVYSIHEPLVECIAKGKEHKKYEFGNKSSFAYTRRNGIIVGAIAFENNPFDGHTLKPQLEQIHDLTGKNPKYSLVDRGYRGQNTIDRTVVAMPKNLKRERCYLKKKREERCRSGAGIEALISHLKHDHRMLRNYLKGTNGDKINTLLAASAYNMRKWMRMKKEEFFVFVLR